MRQQAPPKLGIRGGTSNDQLRRYNLSMVMTLLHHASGCSRAELTQRTGLTRSTIAALVAELVDLGMAYEAEPETAVGRVGRPSLQVFPNPTIAAIAVAPDIDAITVGLVGLGGEVIRRIRFDTVRIQTVSETVNVVKAIVEGMRGEIESGYSIAGVGIAVPGLVNASDGRVLIAPHLGWRDAGLASAMSKVLNYPVYAGNDASLGAIAESLFGAGQDMNDLVYLNGSASGIGGGIIINGVPLRGTSGYAGELGHTLVNSHGIRCHCGRIGCLETEVNMSRLLEVLGLPRADQDELDIALGVSRDPAVLAEVRRQIDFLSEAISNFVNMFDPESVILGGFLGSLLTVGRERLAEAVNIRSMSSAGHEVVIQRASLKSKLMLVGAAELAFAGLLDDPAGYARGGR
ncbi:ROK family transcriptional regulator [Lysinibacter cavernae]|uniref:Putative NBD/HSP70 family sugar kinase n=1 Tax=Lysinibacter cavernae TaxID=1640652 RepID=A0A7X5TU51_9MICO|nr:ROK family transcriptional regulator [Lysinibacter cavernae]NIH54880.1 putative NBD/HSP70 family sugar kinase [Lysinibacter cavernae]